MKKILYILLTGLLFVCASCGTTDDSTGDNGNSSGTGEVQEVQVIADRNFKGGLNVKSQTDGISTPIGVLSTLPSGAVDPKWNLGQWYCGYYHKDDEELYKKYNILNGTHSVNGSKHTFIDESKKLSIDTETGEIGLRLLGTKEYVSNRKQNEPWPHILLEYSMTKNYRLNDLASARFEMEFMLTKLASGYSSKSEIDNNLHTAQFVFYCTLKNLNSQSKDYGKYIWFGLNLFDARYEIIPAFASQDSGKEINTGAFIYQPISSGYLKTPTRLAEDQKINVDLLPRMKDAFNAAQTANFLVNTKWEDLTLCSGNFGFEVTGTYDIAAEITKLNFYAGVKQ